jgi:hypothetical protein
MENFPGRFSTVWKKTGRIFHGVEKTSGTFPQRGKSRGSGTGIFSTLWKTG